MYEDVALPEVEIRQRNGIVIDDDAVIFVYDYRYRWVSVADFIKSPQKLNGCVAPIRKLGRSSLTDVEQESVGGISAFSKILLVLWHRDKIRIGFGDNQGAATPLMPPTPVHRIDAVHSRQFA